MGGLVRGWMASWLDGLMDTWMHDLCNIHTYVQLRCYTYTVHDIHVRMNE